MLVYLVVIRIPKTFSFSPWFQIDGFCYHLLGHNVAIYGLIPTIHHHQKMSKDMAICGLEIDGWKKCWKMTKYWKFMVGRWNVHWKWTLSGEVLIFWGVIPPLNRGKVGCWDFWRTQVWVAIDGITIFFPCSIFRSHEGEWINQFIFGTGMSTPWKLHVDIYIFKYIYMYEHIDICMNIFIYVWIYIYMIYAYMIIYMVYMYMYIYIYAHMLNMMFLGFWDVCTPLELSAQSSVLPPLPRSSPVWRSSYDGSKPYGFLGKIGEP